MKLIHTLAIATSLSLGFVPAAVFAQSVNVTRSILPDQPYTLIYPDVMIATGAAGEPILINHPDAPLQCSLQVVPVEDTTWTADEALAAFDEASVVAGWSETLPGFAVGNKSTVAFQDATALLYDGTSADSSMGMPITLVHTETVSNSRGYTLDCLFATEVNEQARPIVDFIIANFATRSDADCCVGATVEEEATTATE